MNKILFLTALALTACTPTVQGFSSVGRSINPSDSGQATLTLTDVEGFKTVAFAAGKQAADQVVLTLTGLNLAVNDPTCFSNASAQLVCAVGGLPEGRTYVLPARGVLMVEAEYRRQDGKTYTLATD
ncbi:hypothetical protein [Deinococcus sp. QL22]|uniref:hypothetical protein n=1 Tax=Deinococcus sp. QL22 TaxID=2939437 RepID=UPI002018346A|nr:hypothetical protein [Deinococcus sp. QL22]UQN08624.1 hypothetical protein M1R55_21080 [Deinococcus sp. QL22]